MRTSACTYLLASLPGLRRVLLVAPLATLLPITACTDGGDEPGPPDVTTGTYHAYVQTGWTLPHNATQAQALGQDLDGDGTIDNQAGGVIGALINLGLEIDGAAAAAFASGEVVALHRLRADDLAADASIEWRTYDGMPATAPRFDGTDQFDVRGATGRLTGMIRAGHAELSWGETSVALPFFPHQTPLVAPLVQARLILDVDPDGCTGKLAGLIPSREVDQVILPQLAAEIVIHIARHPDHEFTAIAMQVFDRNHDGQLTVDEVLATPLTKGLFRPDTDTDGDGTADAMSFGAGFDCVPATFTPPAE